MKALDLVIVGAGPAGLGTALHLVKIDPSWAERLVILEKASHPRPKVCAGGLTRFAFRQLGKLGLPLGVPYVPAYEVHLQYGRQRITFRGRPMLAMVERSAFDAWLASSALQRGIRILENHALGSVRRAEAGLEVEAGGKHFKAKAIVGADGSASPIRHELLGREQGRWSARVLELIEPARGDEVAFRTGSAAFGFDGVRRRLQGYAWDFPSIAAGKPVFNRGVYDSRTSSRRPRPPLVEILETACRPIKDLDLRSHLRAAPLHLFSPFSRFSAPRVLLVGDAAGADPLFGEGIGVALGYAEVAARLLHRALRRGDFAFSDYRRRLLASPVGRYLTARYLLAQTCYPGSVNDKFMRLIWWLARAWVFLAGPEPDIPGALQAKAAVVQAPNQPRDGTSPNP